MPVSQASPRNTTRQGLQDMKANPMGLTAYAVTASGAARV
jgi:hypothetical protein